MKKGPPPGPHSLDQYKKRLATSRATARSLLLENLSANERLLALGIHGQTLNDKITLLEGILRGMKIDLRPPSEQSDEDTNGTAKN